MMKRFLAIRSTSWLSHCGLIIVVGILLAGCTGRGGGWLPPVPPYSDQATLGFSFSCERSSGSVNPNPPTGRLHIQLAYSDHGTSPFPPGTPFSIHGVADNLDPLLESQICIGQNPPPGGNELIFLGAYRPTGSSTGPIPTSCATDTPLCRFEVIVRDNDGDYAPSQGDFFSIKLSNSTIVSSQLMDSTLVYTRAGVLGGGNITVD